MSSDTISVKISYIKITIAPSGWIIMADDQVASRLVTSISGIA